MQTMTMNCYSMLRIDDENIEHDGEELDVEVA